MSDELTPNTCKHCLKQFKSEKTLNTHVNKEICLKNGKKGYGKGKGKGRSKEDDVASSSSSSKYDNLRPTPVDRKMSNYDRMAVHDRNYKMLTLLKILVKRITDNLDNVQFNIFP